MPEEKPEKSFWTTLPGILTGIAAIIGALASLYLALYSGGPPVSPPPEPTVVPPPPTIHAQTPARYTATPTIAPVVTTPTAKKWGAKITGYITYNGELATKYTQATATISLAEVSTWKSVPIEFQYNNQNAQYTIENVPPGKYTPFIRLESGYPFDTESGGDYYSRISGLNEDIVVSPESVVINRDLKVVMSIHLTKPVDNQVERTSTSDPPVVLYQGNYYPSADLFEWDAVPAAASYSIRFILEDGTTKKVISSKSDSVKATEYYPNLDVTSGNNYYGFLVEAYNSNNEIIGDFQNYYKDGTGGWFEFKVLPRPS